MIEKFISEFSSSQHGREYRIELVKEVDAWETIESECFPVISSSTEERVYSFTLGGESPEIEFVEKDDFLAPVLCSQLRFDVVTHALPEFLLPKGEFSIPVTLFRTDSGSDEVVWAGFIAPMSLSNKYASYYDTFSIVCLDGVGVAKYVEYETDGLLTDTYRWGRYFFRYLNILHDANPNITGIFHVEANTILPDGNRKTFEEMFSSDYQYVDRSTTDASKLQKHYWNEVLSDILRYVGLTLTQVKNEFWLYDAVTESHTFFNHYYWELSQNSATVNSIYTVTSGDYRTDGTSINYFNDVKKVTVTSSPVPFESFELGRDYNKIKTITSRRGELVGRDSISFNELWHNVFYNDAARQRVTNFTTDVYGILKPGDLDSRYITYHNQTITPPHAAVVRYEPVHSGEVTGMVTPTEAINEDNFQDYLITHRGAFPILYSTTQRLDFSNLQDSSHYILMNNQGWSVTASTQEEPAFTYKPHLDSGVNVGYGYLAIDFDLMFCDWNKCASGGVKSVLTSSGITGENRNITMMPCQETFLDYANSGNPNYFAPLSADPVIRCKLKKGNYWWDGKGWISKECTFPMSLGIMDQESVTLGKKNKFKQWCERLGITFGTGGAAAYAGGFAGQEIAMANAGRTLSTVGKGIAAGAASMWALFAVYALFCQREYEKNTGTAYDGFTAKYVKWMYEWFTPSPYSEFGYTIPVSPENPLPRGEVEFSICEIQPTNRLLNPVVYEWVRNLSVKYVNFQELVGEEVEDTERTFTIIRNDNATNRDFSVGYGLHTYQRPQGGIWANTPAFGTWVSSTQYARRPVEFLKWIDYDGVTCEPETMAMSKYVRQFATLPQTEITTSVDFDPDKIYPWTTYRYCFTDGDHIILSQRISLKSDVLEIKTLRNNRDEEAYRPQHIGAASVKDVSGAVTQYDVEDFPLMKGDTGIAEADFSALYDGSVDLKGILSGCTSLTAVTMPSAYSYDGDAFSGAFAGCSALTDINLGGVHVSGANAFSGSFDGCSSLTGMTINPSLVSGTENTPLVPTLTHVTTVGAYETDAHFEACKNLYSGSVRDILERTSEDSAGTLYFDLTYILDDEEYDALDIAVHDAQARGWTIIGLTLFRQDIEEYSVTLTPHPGEYGECTGGGVYSGGTEIAIAATPFGGYAFSAWTSGGVIISTASTLTLVVQSDIDLQAEFYIDKQKCNIQAVCEPLEAGAVIGTGSYYTGDRCALTTLSTQQYPWLGWYSGSTFIDSAQTLVFTVTGDASYIARFEHGQPENEIWYTTPNSATVAPTVSTGFGATLTANTYADGKGILHFDGPVTQIPASGFKGTSIETMSLPNSVIRIGDYGFHGCTSLKSFNVPANVENIGGVTFFNTPELSSLTVSPANRAYEDRDDDAIYVKGENTLLKGTKNTRFSGTVDTIARNAFSYVSGFSYLDLPDSLTTIENAAFSYMRDMRGIHIPSGVTSLGSQVFAGCNSLETMTVDAKTAPDVSDTTFQNIAPSGTLYYSENSDYSAWLSDDPYYLGYYHWNETGGTYGYPELCADVRNGVKSVVTGEDATLMVNWLNSGNAVTNDFSGVPTIRELNLSGLTQLTEPQQMMQVGLNSGIRTLNLSNLQSVSGYRSLAAAFQGQNLSGTLDLNSLATVSGDQAFYRAFAQQPLSGVSLKRLSYLGGNSAFCETFKGNTAITAFTFPPITDAPSVTSTFKSTFSGCTNLSSVTLTGFSDAAFANMTLNSGWEGTFIGCPVSTLKIGGDFARYSRADRNPMGSMPGLRTVHVATPVTRGFYADWNSGLTSASVVEILSNLDTGITASQVCRFYTGGGLTFTADPADTIRTISAEATSHGWSIQNLNIISTATPEYLTFTYSGTGSTTSDWVDVYLDATSEVSKYTAPALEYSYNGTEWYEYALRQHITVSNRYHPSVMFRGNNSTFSDQNTQFVFGTQRNQGNVVVSGNLMTLLDKTGRKLTLDTPREFRGLFKNFATYAFIGDLSLPATGLTEGCYYETFYNANILGEIELPATTLAEGCYYQMFYQARFAGKGTTMRLPARDIPAHAYQSMFQVANAPVAVVIDAVSVGTDAMDRMFDGANNIKSIEVNFTQWEPSSTTYWVYGIEDYGEFIKPAALPEVRSYDCVPKTWYVSIK